VWSSGYTNTHIIQYNTTTTIGDDNGDGVLSFQEFMHVVHSAAPHFHHRRILKMYRYV